MRPKIVFVVMSAINKPATTEQLARALAPHIVLVHHDFHQTPHFPLEAPNVRFVPNPRRTGWAVFGFTDGIFHSLRHALENLDFDYLQLLSPTCLPIRPLQLFEAHVSGPADAHFDCIDLLRDRDALMSVGYRAFTPEESFRHRVARRLSRAYFGAEHGRRDEAGIWLRSGAAPGVRAVDRACQHQGVVPAVDWPSHLRRFVSPVLRLDLVRCAPAGRRGAWWTSFHAPWFTTTSAACASPMSCLMPSLLMHLGVRKGPMNHFIQPFDQAHTGEIHEEDIDQLKRSSAFFARKFPDDPAATVRLRVLRELADSDCRSGSDPV